MHSQVLASMQTCSTRTLCFTRKHISETAICLVTLRDDVARYSQDQPSWTEIKAWIGPVEVDEEMMHAPEEMGAAEAGNVAVELSSPRGSVSCFS